jgi:hypothetical protein
MKRGYALLTTKIKVIAVMCVLAALSCLGIKWHIDSLNDTIRKQKLEIVTANHATMDAVGANHSLSATVDNLTARLQLEQHARQQQSIANATMVARTEKAEKELEELLSHEKDNCGRMRLSQPVIDRMWQSYKSYGSSR